MNATAALATTISTTPADLDAALTELEALNVDTATDRRYLAQAARRDRQGQTRKAQNLRESIAYDIASHRLALAVN